MIRRVLLLLILFYLTINDLFGETEFRNEGTIFMKLYGGSSSASGYYDLDGIKINSLTDENSQVGQKDYTMDLTKGIMGLNCEYSVSESFMVFCDIPLTINELDEIYKSNDTTGLRYNKANYTLTHLEYVGLGAKYLLYSKKSYSFIMVEGRIPPGFKRGIPDTTGKKFLSDGAFELRTGLGIGLKSESYFLESIIAYNYRDEELADEVVIKLEAGLSNVPDAKLSIVGEFVQSMKSFKYAIPLKINETVTQEDYFAMGFEFSMFFSELFYGEFNYILRLSGKNTWNYGTYRIGIGVLFD
ncbi:MAG: hypothetical protein EPN82_00375 [Bacteroidetes bacterium]|nr:MAG: hypothetical protein EPN82_00375 [Bacteroidota bacterium]